MLSPNSVIIICKQADNDCGIVGGCCTCATCLQQAIDELLASLFSGRVNAPGSHAAPMGVARCSDLSKFFASLLTCSAGKRDLSGHRTITFCGVYQLSMLQLFSCPAALYIPG